MLVRKHYQQRHRFDAIPIASVQLNLECRDKLVHIPFGLLYIDTALRGKVVTLIETTSRTTEHFGALWESMSGKTAMVSLYSDLLNRASQLLGRADDLAKAAQSESSSTTVLLQITAIEQWTELTEQVCDTARRRVLLGEAVSKKPALNLLSQLNLRFNGL